MFPDQAGIYTHVPSQLGFIACDHLTIYLSVIGIASPYNPTNLKLDLD